MHGDAAEGLLLLFVIFVAYFIPSFVATAREHHNAGAIFALNLLLGWTVLGWCAAIIWACTAVRHQQSIA